MLKIYVGDFKENCIVNVNGYFDVYKKKEWFNNPRVKEIIKNIDRSNAVKDEYIESPVLGAIPPQKLSGGCKAVILMEVLDKSHVYATKCGDNCVSDILKIAKEKDVEITLHHVMEFPEHFEAMMMESGKKVTSMEEFVDEFYKIRSNNR